MIRPGILDRKSGLLTFVDFGTSRLHDGGRPALCVCYLER